MRLHWKLRRGIGVPPRWAIVILFGALSAPATAQDAGPAAPSVSAPEQTRIGRIRHELAMLKQAVERLETQLAAADGQPELPSDPTGRVTVVERTLQMDRAQPAGNPPSTPTPTAGREGFALRSADGQFQLRVRGVLQSDGRFFPGAGEDRPAPASFVMRRVRPILEGTLFRSFSFRIAPDFGGGVATLQDAYLDLQFTPAIGVRAGKFKSPVGLERLTSATELLFAERALPTALAPNRDLGIVVFGQLLTERLTYTAGVTNGVVDGASGDADDRDGKDLVARVFAHPFRTNGHGRLTGLGIGVAGSFGAERGSLIAPSLPAYRTSGQVVFARYRVDAALGGTAVADGDHWRIAPQGYYYTGPFGALGEYIRSSQQVRRGPAAARLETRAWQAALSYVVTGEDRTPHGVSPRAAFDASNGAWGALELTGRYNALQLDRDAFPVFANPTTAARAARAWGIGTNWYLNRALKLTLDFEQTRFEGGGPSGDRRTERNIVSRFQIAY